MNSVALSEQLDSLAERVLAGEVAFFVGAGFSLDSEKNSTARLQVRLLARFAALTHVLEETNLCERFSDTFKLSQRVSASENVLLSSADSQQLGREYYALNDWMCAAFASLIDRLLTADEKQASAWLDLVHELENKLLVGFGDSVPIAPVDLASLGRIRNLLARGKALFLETLGFGSSDIMAGEPLEADPFKVQSSYRRRPRRRHEVLARLAREGLCPTLVTTNYDLLIEGAYRLAGFESRTTPTEELIAPTLTPHFAIVADPLEFFERGDGSRTALVLKLHGCARLYREAKQRTLEQPPPAHHPALEGGETEWERYLRAIVYTYREIQNWREDSWSRDFLRTLMRTRTLVLCGYSAADSVVHDTFRTVYEELSRYRRARRPRGGAPAFFLGPRTSWEFHGAEILRAASQAVGERLPELTNHPNYVQFEFVAPGVFPTMDDLFVWLFHRVLRRRQEQALQHDLRRVATQLLVRPPVDSEVERIRAKFTALLAAETELAKELGPGAPRGRFASLVDWTDHFHVGFMRQLGFAEALARRQRSRLQIDQLRRLPTWYFPVSDRPEWAAWAVVVEIAVRELLAAAPQSGARTLAVDWKNLPEALVLTSSDGAPTLSWHDQRGASMLTIRWRGDPVVHRRLFPGAPRRSRCWWPSGEHLPWSREVVAIAGAPPPTTPDARAIWNLAAHGATEADARRWLPLQLAGNAMQDAEHAP